MASERIGHVKCWLCGSEKAGVSVSKSGLCCVTCNACHAQTFARGNYADSMIRQSMRPIAAAVAAACEQIGQEQAAKPEKVEPAKQAKEPEPAKPTSAAPAAQVERVEEKPKGSGGYGMGFWGGL